MPGRDIEWRETVSRGAAIALMSNFTSVADALKELVDNAIDYRWGQQFSVLVDEGQRPPSVIIESDGGRGMGAAEIQDWLNWGQGQKHASDHIGMYHQGGKAACGYLGNQVRLWAKRQDEEEVWLFQDDNWARRAEPKNFGPPQPVSMSSIPITMVNLPRERGHVRIEISKLVRDKRWNLEVLRRSLASTYRTLLMGGDIEIRVKGESVQPLEIPLSTGTEKRDIQVRLQGRSVNGWAGRLKRDQLTSPLKSGFRLVYNGRLVFEGEWFGYNHEGKGALNSLIGELNLSGFKPLPNKTDFLERGDTLWDTLGVQVLEQSGPLISELRRASDEVRVTKKERDTAREVAEELAEVLSALHVPPELGEPKGGEAHTTAVQPAGRKRPEPSPVPRHSSAVGPGGGGKEPATPPPDDPAGRLNRLLRQISGGDMKPPVRIRAWDQAQRTTWTTEGATRWLDINKNYPLYRSLGGSKGYVAESAILQLCQPMTGETLDSGRYLESVNLMLLRWAQVTEEWAESHIGSGQNMQMSLG